MLIDRDAPTVLYMAGSAAVLRSRDSGATWEAVLEPIGGSISDLVMDPSNPRRLYAGVTGAGANVGGVYRTEDGGDAWFRLTGCPGQRLPDVAETPRAIQLLLDQEQAPTIADPF